MMATLQTVTGDNGVDTTLVVSMVTALVGTISALAGLIYRQLRQQIDQCTDRSHELEEKLDGYRDITPEMLRVIRERLDIDAEIQSTRRQHR
jgi:hypothetical protein